MTFTPLEIGTFLVHLAPIIVSPACFVAIHALSL